ncbi:MAG: cysteine dioxygenase [Myxococcales bacterium]
MRTLLSTCRYPRPLFPDQLLGTSLPERTLTPAELAAWARRVRTARLDWALLAPFLRFEAERYARIPLAVSRHWELVLVSWLPGQASAVHDHGGSHGASVLLAGALLETSFRRQGRRLVPVRRRRVQRGQAMLEGHGGIHRVANDAERPAISLHLYSPPLCDVRVYPEPGPARVEDRAGYAVH